MSGQIDVLEAEVCVLERGHAPREGGHVYGYATHPRDRDRELCGAPLPSGHSGFVCVGCLSGGDDHLEVGGFADAVLARFQAGMVWSEETPEEVRELVHGNLRGLAAMFEEVACSKCRASGARPWKLVGQELFLCQRCGVKAYLERFPVLRLPDATWSVILRALRALAPSAVEAPGWEFREGYQEAVGDMVELLGTLREESR